MRIALKVRACHPPVMCTPTWQSDGEWAQSKVVDSQDQQVMSSQRIDILIFALEDAKSQGKPLQCWPTKGKVEKTSEVKADSFHLGGDHWMRTKSISSRRRPLAKTSRRRPLAKLRIILGGDR